MRQLPVLGRIYLVLCYLAGALALGWLLFSSRAALELEQWALAMALAAAASVCQVLVVARDGTAGQRSDHLTLAPLFAAVLLLPRPLLALVIIWTFIPEWYLRRRAWFGQLFNISAFLVAAVLAKVALQYLIGTYRLTEADELISVMALYVVPLIPLFQVTQTLLLALVLKLARGQSFRTSGLFEPASLVLEFALLCMGLGFATSWVVHPVYGLLAAVPLVLIFQALHVPNLLEQATTDSKTGLANMRHFNSVLAREFERAQRSGQPLSILMCDLDYLRNINNTYGHQAGDVVLVGVADILRANTRADDLAARFGGEEFAVLLVGAGVQLAAAIAERIRRELEQNAFDVGLKAGPIEATISIGIAAYPRDGDTPEVVMREADLAVYQAKRDGRNRVAVASYESRGLAGEWAREHLVPATTPGAAVPPAARPFAESINRLTRAAVTAETSPPAGPGRPAASADGRSRRRRRDDAEPRVLGFIALTVIGGLLGLLPGLPPGEIPWWPLLLFAGLTVLAEQVAVDNVGQGKISVSTVTILSAGFLYAEAGIAVTALAAVVSMAVKARTRLYRMFFNFGAVLLAAEAGYWTFELLVARPIGANPFAAMLVPAVAAGLAYHVVNQVLLCLVRGLSEYRRPWDIWYSEYRWLWPHYAVLGALALVVALGSRTFGPLGVVALMAPVGMMHFAIKQYLDHTRIYVQELRRMNERLGDSYQATLQALSRALDTRDDETESHSQRVCRYTELLARRLQVPDEELEHMLRGALLHDIGKIGVPDAVLLKSGELTEDERRRIRQHPEIGYNMIANIPFLSQAAQIVLHHHEAYDGSGYPSGLRGENIPLGARIFAVADAFDAMTSDRPYRAALSPQVAMAEIERCRGAQFDPEVVDALLSIPLPELLAVQTDADADRRLYGLDVTRQGLVTVWPAQARG